MSGDARDEDPLALFDPVVSQWFTNRFGIPTAIQDLAWPRISQNEHVLLSAPTGSGKTLTSFLWALNQLATGTWPTGELSVLYVSPLKALNNDIRVNLREPLQGITATFEAARRTMPEITVRTRSGDTPQNERQQMVRHPPEILITTPESLNLILSSSRAREMLRTIRTVILDEIHSVVGSKRGTHLITAVDRLPRLCGEFQRIALSATVRPMETVARFVGGYQRFGEGFEPRQVRVLSAPREKKLDLSVTFPGEGMDAGADSVWPSLIAELRAVIDRNTSTLIFVTTRAHAEKITELLNEGEETPLAYAHHGSLSREIRSAVEESLKAGRLRAIVATNSLELGIDIGELDQVVMVRSPMSIASALQRIGRAGHRVGATSRGVLFPLHGRDAMEAAVMAKATVEQDIESTLPIMAPLDVLAQQIISMTAVETRDIDDLFDEIKSSWPYHELSRAHFNLVIEMAAGRYASTRIRDLRPRIIVDRVDNTIRAAAGALPVLYQSGGTIPDRGYYGLRISGSGAKVGELDEEFVWERRVGDTFYLGSQLWTIAEINERNVEVVPGNPGKHIIPFWKAEQRGRGSHFAERIMDFLEAADQAIAAGNLESHLASSDELSETTREAIDGFLTSQRLATGTGLPHRHHVLVEHYHRPQGVPGGKRPARHPRGVGASATDSQEIIIHCPWGMGVTQPLVLALQGLWDEDGLAVEGHAEDSSLSLLLPSEMAVEQVLSPAQCRALLRGDRIERLLRRRLEHSGLFGALFRENAGRALLLPRGGFNRRMPLWLNRLRSKKLLGAVAEFDDFPIVLETWRTCLQDRFDLSALRQFLSELATGTIRVSHCDTTTPSPFAADVVWKQTNLFMYLDDSRAGGHGSSLSDELLKQAAHQSALRPEIPAELAVALEQRLQRVAPGYAPEPGRELVEFVAERIAIPSSEISELHDAMTRDHEEQPAELPDRLCWIIREGRQPLLTAITNLGVVRTLLPDLSATNLRIVDAASWWMPPQDGNPVPPETATRFLGDDHMPETPPDAATVLAAWVRFYGPRTPEELTTALGMKSTLFAELADDLVEQDTLITGMLTAGTNSPQLCDAENLELLLSMLRRSHRPVFTPVGGKALVPLWSRTTGLSGGAEPANPGDPSRLVAVLDALFGYPAPAALWETDIFPARMPGYYPLWLDGLFKESNLLWLGCGSERLTFALANDTTLFAAPGVGPAPGVETTPVVAALRENGPSDFWKIADTLELSSAALTESLWATAWDGLVSNDSYQTVRQGTLSRFRTEPAAGDRPASSSWPGARSASRGHGRATSRASWATSRPLSGSWFALGTGESPGTRDSEDPIAALELDKERARILLARYGLVFREVLARELPGLRWARVFRALRMMELSGEVVAGAFVDGLPGIQFATPMALSMLSAPGKPGSITWMSAADPASPCGLPLSGIYGDLPSRVASNHLVFRDSELVMVSRRNGADVTFRVDPDDPDLGAMTAPLRSMVNRRWNPRNRVLVITINDNDARESPYAPSLAAAGFRRDHRGLVLSASVR